MFYAGVLTDTLKMTVDDLTATDWELAECVTYHGHEARDRYAEARRAYQDGELQVRLGGQWINWDQMDEPTWNDAPECYRREPQEEK